MRKKSKTVTFRVTDDEYKMIKEKAKISKLTVTQFIVKCCSSKDLTVMENESEK